MSAPDERRKRGLEKIVEVYGEDFGIGGMIENAKPEGLPMHVETIDHLFGEVWNRPGLSTRDRRLLCLGVIAALGRADLAETQFVGALKNEELTREELGEVLLQLAYYAGWPNASAMSQGAAAATKRVFGD